MTTRPLVVVWKLLPLILLCNPMATAWNVARTPPMGFNTWNHYHCSVDADILTQTATAMKDVGLLDAGYEFVNSDDCWMLAERSASTGNQIADPAKFPNGFKAVADFIHGLGMKSGLYTAKGPHTCAKRAASCNHEAQDAKQWASWGIDYVKDDSCSICVNNTTGQKFSDMEDYHRMWLGIQESGRPMVLTVEGSPRASNITRGGYGNAKRVGHDISPSWGSMISLVDIGAGLWPYAHGTLDEKYGGWWNDLDMIEIGNGRSVARSTSVMYPWAVDPAKGGKQDWSMAANGTVKSKGLCLTVGPTVALTTCTANNPAQAWTLEANGNLHQASKKSSCLALYGGSGPGTVMALCKSGTAGANEEFTLANGSLCSTTLHSNGVKLCLVAEATKPGGGGGGGGDGFECAANPAALARCQVHFTMWTIMKAPLLLGDDVRQIDNVTLGVLTNKEAISISQDALGHQAQRVWTSNGNGDRSFISTDLDSAAAVAAPCNGKRSTQSWSWRKDGSSSGTPLMTTDDNGNEWCLHDVEGTEEIGSWRAVPCAAAPLSKFTEANILSNGKVNIIAIMTPGGQHLSVNNAMGASGPVASSRHVGASDDTAQTWVKSMMGEHFRLMASDRVGIRNDDKAGRVTRGGDWCLDIANDGDSEVWVGELVDGKWAVALLNRHTNAAANITLDYVSMLNVTKGTSFAVHSIWKAAEVGTHKDSYTAEISPQAVAYLILTPARSIR